MDESCGRDIKALRLGHYALCNKRYLRAIFKTQLASPSLVVAGEQDVVMHRNMVDTRLVVVQ